jgi:hypothetical protein
MQGPRRVSHFVLYHLVRKQAAPIEDRSMPPGERSRDMNWRHHRRRRLARIHRDRDQRSPTKGTPVPDPADPEGSPSHQLL